MPVLTLAELRVGDRLPFGRRVAAIECLGPAGAPEAEYTIRLADGIELHGRGDSPITVDTPEGTDNDRA